MLISVFNTSDFLNSTMGPNCTENDLCEEVKQCRYRGFRNNPEDENKYQNSEDWMLVFTARLVFIVIFEVISVSFSTYASGQPVTLIFKSRKPCSPL